MAATLTQERFTGPEWIFERKLDGVRLVGFQQGADVRLYSRNRLLQHVPTIAAAVAGLPLHDAILDGEVTWPSGRVEYHVFDVVWMDGRMLTELPLIERRSLMDALPLHAPLQRVAILDDPEPWERARVEGWEGVIAKRLDSTYEQRRSRSWLKMKCEVSQHFVVEGFTDPQGPGVRTVHVGGGRERGSGPANVYAARDGRASRLGGGSMERAACQAALTAECVSTKN